MTEQMVTVEAADGLALTGFEVAGPRRDAGIVWIHGFGVGYDLPECLELGRQLAHRGIGFVAGNVRGHDGGAAGFRRRGGGYDVIPIGSWWEIFEDSAKDVAAWVDHARRAGFPRLVVAGHSFGGLKAVYYVSSVQPRDLAGLALVSPSFGLLYLDAKIAAQAASLVADGRGTELLPPGSWPRGFGTDTVSAQTYASWSRVAPTLFGEGPTRFADIRCPLLVVYGAAGDVGGQAEIDRFRALATSTPRFDSAVVPGLRHRYAGAENVLAGTVEAWIAAIVGATGQKE
jgi:alpha-beta hydrolase superfamily lysophospholipase